MATNSTASNVTGMVYKVEFNYQSGNIDFVNWISLLTICLAPLIAHIISGIPTTVYLYNRKPFWHDKFVHWNPTSIIWRYFAITDRRVRARNWDAMHMAAGNAIFWTAHGWDGSEKMMVRCREICVQTPPPLIERMVSKDTMKTLIVTIQGIQAIGLLIFGSVSFADDDGILDYAINAIFMPISIIGLLRLPAAIWLTDDHLFMNKEDFTEMEQTEPIRMDSHNSTTSSFASNYTERPLLIYEHRLPDKIHPTASEVEINEAFYPSNTARGMSVRAFYFVFLLALFAMCVWQMYPRGPTVYTATNLLLGYFYAVILLATIVIYIMSWRKLGANQSTTVIPYISTRWYKLYSSIVMTMFFVLIVIAALETRRTYRGNWTTFPPKDGQTICKFVPKANATFSN